MSGSSRVASDDEERLQRYVNRFFVRSGRTEFPTVRQCARTLRLPQSQIEALVEDTDGGLMLTGYSFNPEPLGDLYVEAIKEEES